MVITHNVTAMYANNRLKKNTDSASKAIEKLSSGYRIGKASDDAAGLAISEKMRSQIRGLEMASRNIQDGISLVQTAEGGLGEILSPTLQRMRELALQAASGTFTDDDRDKMQLEFEQMGKSIDSIANNTDFNGMKLLNSQQVDGVANNPIPKPVLKSIDWNYVNNGNNFTAKDICYDGTGKYVAIGTSNGQNQIMYSNDAVNWTKAAYSPIPADVIYGNGVFIVTGANSGSYGTDEGIIFSMDGINWSNSVNTNPPIDLTCLSTVENSIAFDGSKFTMVGYSAEDGFYKTLTSTNGVDWEVHSNPDKIGCISFGGGKYVGQGYGDVYTSNDGISWNYEKTIGHSGYSTDAVLYEGSKYFVVGEDHGALSVSDDGVNWNQVNIENGTDFESIAYDGNQYLAIGYVHMGGKSVIYNSSDGLNWSLQKELSAGGSDEISKVIWDGTKFIASDKDGFSLGIPKYEDSPKPMDNDGKPLDIILQVGADTGDTMKITLCDARTSSIGLATTDIKSISSAENAISKIDKAIEIIASHRSRMGAYQNSLEHISNNVENYNQNITASESRIRDLDMAKEMMSYTKDNILSQASEAMVSQANQQAEKILQLLKI